MNELFISNKYTKWYFSIIKNAISQNRKRKDGNYYESHHIIPQCLGGIEEVLLTAKEHFICHLLLTKMCKDTPSQKKMMYAFCMMRANGKNLQRENNTSIMYSYYKNKIREMRSEDQKIRMTDKIYVKSISNKRLKTLLQRYGSVNPLDAPGAREKTLKKRKGVGLSEDSTQRKKGDNRTPAQKLASENLSKLLKNRPAHNRKETIVFGQKFSSVNEACKILNLSTSQYYYLQRTDKHFSTPEELKDFLWKERSKKIWDTRRKKAGL